MCTLLIARNVFRFYPLVVAANRDERLKRPSSCPTARDGERNTLAPVDEVFGGTWIGVNDAGVVAAITNRPEVPHVSGKLSRGTLVSMALTHATAMEAVSALVCLRGSLYNGFHLAVCDAEDGFILLGDGKTLKAGPLYDGLSVITERGWEPSHSERARRIERIFAREVGDFPPRPATFAPILDLHDRPDGGPGESGACLHGGPDDEWVTKSSSVIRPQDRDGRRFWEFFHRERPDGRPNCEGRWELHELDIG